ncbi:MAG: hypothetical protein JW880_01955 [Candidatus Thermoplasmatota archaeon]|nr:hypothetical protein [Candidatus Thermoplasmatota archaeon]
MVALLTAISVFAEATPLTLITFVLGGTMILIGLFYSYRPGAIMGVVAVAIGAASSIQLDSVLEVGTVLTAILGLLLPVFLLALQALGAEDEDVRVTSIKGRPTLHALLFGLACVVAAPVFVGLTSLILPTMTMRLGGTAETAILLIAAAAGSILLTRRTSARKTIGPRPETPEGQ